MVRRVAATHGVAFLLLAACAVAEAQPTGSVGYRQLNGSLALGWLDTTTTALLAGSTRNPFTSVSFDYRDAVVDPTFINYRIQPTFGTGFQDLFGTSSPRSGVAAEVAFLPARPFPLRAYYSRFRRHTLAASSQYFGRILAQNDDSLAGVRWQLLVPQWPKLDFSASDSNVETRPEEVLSAGYATHSRNLALNASDTRWGWIFDGDVQFQQLDAERLAASASGAVPFDSATDLRMLRFLGRRDVGRWFLLVLNATGSQVDSSMANGYVRQSYDAYSARLLFRPHPRASSWVEVRLMDTDLEARSTDLSGSDFVVPQTRTANQIADWETRYEAVTGLNLLGRLEFTSVTTSSTVEPEQHLDFINAVVGVQFQRQMGWSDLSAAYTLNRYRRRTVSGLSDSEQLGHAADVSVSVGRPSAVRVTVGYALTRSRDEVRTALPYTSDSDRLRAAIEKDLGRGVRIEAHWDLTDTTYEREDLRSDFRGQGYGGTLTLRRFSASFDRGFGSGDAVQQILNPGLPPIPGTPTLFIVGSDNAYTTASVTWPVTPSLSLRGHWRDQRQAIGVLQTSQIEQREASLRYNFRKIQVEGGYVFDSYDFGSPVYRKSLLFRVVRDFQLF